MKKDVSKVLEAFKALEIDFDEAHFDILTGRENELGITGNEQGILSLAFLLIAQMKDENFKSHIPESTYSKFFIDVELFETEYFSEKRIKSFSEKLKERLIGLGVYLIFFFIVISFFYGAFQLLSKLF